MSMNKNIYLLCVCPNVILKEQEHNHFHFNLKVQFWCYLEWNTVLKGNNLPIVRRACLKKQRLNSHVTLLGHSLHLCLVFLCRHTMHARLIIIILQTFMLVFTTSSSFLLRNIFRENGLIQTYLAVQKKASLVVKKSSARSSRFLS